MRERTTCIRSKLHAEGIIKTRGALFEESAERELPSLAERGVYDIKDYDKRIHGKIRKFNSPTIQRASQRLISKIQRILTAPWRRPSAEKETVDVSALPAHVQSDPRQSQWQKQANPTEAVPFTSRTGPPPALSISAVSTAKWKTLDGKPIPFSTGEDPAHIRLVRETLLERLTHLEGFFSKKSSTHLPSPDSRREVVLELRKPLE